jgi:anthranilate synthase/aminodeoxychorismate synthase-like glutamine amidotransferase
MILVIDNYDSFTYNLVQYVSELGAQVVVERNDAVTVSDIASLSPEGLILSPGPGTPDDAGVTLESIERFAGEIPMLGVCLGHQAIAQSFGGRIVRAERLMHGRTSPIHHDKKGVFAGLPEPFLATRYHSLIVERAALPEELVETAWTAEGELMGLRHRTLPIEAVQFHPESFLTEGGHRLLRNWLEMLGGRGRGSGGEAA